MTITVQKVNDGFRFFPYPPDLEYGRTNNGGIDLLQHPERLDEITELAKVPVLRSFIEKLNGPTSRFMTLGFEAGEWNDSFCGYLEWALRDPAHARKVGVYQEITDTFVAWVAKDYPEWSQAVDQAIVAETQPFHYHGVFHGNRATFWFRAPHQDGFEGLVRLLGHFLLRQYTPAEASV